MTSPPGYSYRSSLKSDLSDEPVNTYLIRPVAGLIVRILYPLPVTPNQVTVVSILFGVLAAAAFLHQDLLMVAAGGVLLEVKDVLDSADGQLARARGKGSRGGRFLDSIGDLLVNLMVFVAIAFHLYEAGASGAVFWAAGAAFVCTTLRVSFHVYYQTSYLHLSGTYGLSRLTEELTPEDYMTEDRITLLLHRVFLLLYGWQDLLMTALDRWMLPGRTTDETGARRWYEDPIALRMGGFLGLGTELFVLSVCAVAGRFDVYLVVNLIGLNTLWVAVMLYRRLILVPRVRASGAAPGSR